MNFNSIKIYLRNPNLLLLRIGQNSFLKLLNDEKYLKLLFKSKMNRRLDINSPTTFNEKLQWLKLNDRNPLYTKLVDKADVKEYVKSQIGEDYIIETLGVYNNFDDIDFGELPEQFVIKCTHNSGGLVICRDKNCFNLKRARKTINRSLNKNYYWSGREWPYKNVKPRIIVERYMEDQETSELRDYKFFCFGGQVKAMFVASERQKSGAEVKFDFFDDEFNHLPVKQGHPNASIQPQKPEQFEKMKILASKLSQNIPHVRVDFYEVDKKVYFGEMTFFHFSGTVPFTPNEWDKTFGDWIDLTNLKY